MRLTVITHEFVENIPASLQGGKIYVSIPYATAVHKCLCGCGQEVVTPISPTNWKLSYDGETVSLEPSIGNWNFSCQSHYWIKRNKVQWARQWSREEIEAGKSLDRAAKQKYFHRSSQWKESSDTKKGNSLWTRILRRFR